jgi:hypothetical protein
MFNQDAREIYGIDNVSFAEMQDLQSEIHSNYDDMPAEYSLGMGFDYC